MRIALLVGLVASLAGCSAMATYPGRGDWDRIEKVLGTVEACQGGFCCPEGKCQWPMSLTTPPPAETYQEALLDDAVKRYGVERNRVVLGPIQVEIQTEIVGTVRGWSAKSNAGLAPKPEPPVDPKLETLRDLLDRGVISAEEYQRERKRAEGP